MRRLRSALLLALWTCSNAAPGVSMPTPSSEIVALSQASGTLVFPPADGFSPKARFSISGTPEAGTSVSLTTLAADSGSIPKPTDNATALVAMQLTTTAPFVLNHFLVWSIAARSNVSADIPLGIEVFDGNASIAEYAATLAEGQVRSVAFGADVSVATGHTYTYVLERNPTLSRMPQ